MYTTLLGSPSRLMSISHHSFPANHTLPSDEPHDSSAHYRTGPRPHLIKPTSPYIEWMNTFVETVR